MVEGVRKQKKDERANANLVILIGRGAGEGRKQERKPEYRVRD